MKEAIDACSQELRRLGRDYYFQQLSREEYVAQRKHLLDRLEAETRSGTDESRVQSAPSQTSSASPVE